MKLVVTFLMRICNLLFVCRETADHNGTRPAPDALLVEADLPGGQRPGTWFRGGRRPRLPGPGGQRGRPELPELYLEGPWPGKLFAQ